MGERPQTALIERLRTWRHGDLPVARVLLTEAADEIQRLQAEFGTVADAVEDLERGRHFDAEEKLRNLVGRVVS